MLRTAVLGMGAFVGAGLLIMAAAFAASVQATPSLQGNATLGEQKAAVCAACHGPMGNSVNPLWPSLAGQHEGYVRKHLMLFRSGERVAPLMNPQSANLTDQDIADLAAYYAKQTPKPGLANAEANLKLGERLYRAGDHKAGITACVACHGPSGRGNPLTDTPNLQGLKADYLAEQLRAYQTGARSASKMTPLSALMNEAQIEAVSAFMEGLTPTDWRLNAPQSSTAPDLTTSAHEADTH